MRWGVILDEGRVERSLSSYLWDFNLVWAAVCAVENIVGCAMVLWLWLSGGGGEEV